MMGTLDSGRIDAVKMELLFRAALVIFIVEGLAAKLYQSASAGLNSDTVGMGLLSMEIGKHQNYLLSGYHVAAADSFIFTELLPFQLIPQILTNYNPLALKLVTFGIFLIGVLVLALLVYKVSRQINAALVFAALAANIPPAGFWWFAEPTTHNATIVFGGIILLLLLHIDSLGKAASKRQEGSGKHKKIPAPTEPVPWAYIGCLAIVVFFTALSDTIVLAWVIVPYTLIYLTANKEKNKASNIALISVAGLSVLAYLLKMYVITEWFKQPLRINPVSQILANVPLFFETIGQYMVKGQPMGSNWAGLPNLTSLLSFIALCAIIGCAWLVLTKKKEYRLLVPVLLLSITTMFLYFLLSDYVFDIGAGRYLTFTALAVAMLIALIYTERKKMLGALVVVLLLLSAVNTVLFLTTWDFMPNAKEYALIQYLKDNGLTHGYSDYLSANVITYLSGEDVTVRRVNFNPGGIEPNLVLSCDRWYKDTPDEGFLLFDNMTLDTDSRAIVDILTSNINASLLKNQSYLIYSYNLSAGQK